MSAASRRTTPCPSKSWAVALALGGLVCSTGLAGFAAKADPITIGVSWPGLAGDRWAADRQAMRAAIEKAGDIYLSADAEGSPARQAADIEGFISKGAKAIVVVAADPKSILPAVNQAITRGVAIVAYERPIESPDALYVAYDDVEAGRMMGAALLAAKPAGAYAFIRGPKDDPRSDLIFSGVMERLQPAMTAGKARTAGEAHVENWSPGAAMAAMQDMLGQTGGKIDAVAAESDAMAGGAAAALSAQALTGAVAVSGVGGDHASINRVALGTQTISVREDRSDLGRMAGEAAVALALGKKPADIGGAKPFSISPKGAKFQAVLLPPLAVTRDTLGVVVDKGWMTKAQVCSGVKPGATPFCG